MVFKSQKRSERKRSNNIKNNKNNKENIPMVPVITLVTANHGRAVVRKATRRTDPYDFSIRPGDLARLVGPLAVPASAGGRLGRLGKLGWCCDNRCRLDWVVTLGALDAGWSDVWHVVVRHVVREVVRWLDWHVVGR